MEELILLIKPVLVPIIVDVITTLMRRRNSDAKFAMESDQVFAKVAAAQTEDERLDAAKALQDLLSH